MTGILERPLYVTTCGPVFRPVSIPVTEAKWDFKLHWTFAAGPDWEFERGVIDLSGAVVPPLHRDLARALNLAAGVEGRE